MNSSDGVFVFACLLSTHPEGSDEPLVRGARNRIFHNDRTHGAFRGGGGGWPGGFPGAGVPGGSPFHPTFAGGSPFHPHAAMPQAAMPSGAGPTMPPGAGPTGIHFQPSTAGGMGTPSTANLKPAACPSYHSPPRPSTGGAAAHAGHPQQQPSLAQMPNTTTNPAPQPPQPPRRSHPREPPEMTGQRSRRRIDKPGSFDEDSPEARLSFDENDFLSASSHVSVNVSDSSMDADN